MRAPGTVVIALALCWLLGGCASVPTSGPIHAGPVLDAAAESQFIRVIAAPPSVGASPEEIVAGFLDAAVSLEDDRAIARQYLTDEAARLWEPEEATTVYDAERVRIHSEGRSGVVAVRLREVGRLA